MPKVYDNIAPEHIEALRKVADHTYLPQLIATLADVMDAPWSRQEEFEKTEAEKQIGNARRAILAEKLRGFAGEMDKLCNTLYRKA